MLGHLNLAQQIFMSLGYLFEKFALKGKRVGGELSPPPHQDAIGKADQKGRSSSVSGWLNGSFSLVSTVTSPEGCRFFLSHRQNHILLYLKNFAEMFCCVSNNCPFGSEPYLHQNNRTNSLILENHIPDTGRLVRWGSW